jgi:hypothetical protein
MLLYSLTVMYINIYDRYARCLLRMIPAIFISGIGLEDNKNHADVIYTLILELTAATATLFNRQKPDDAMLGLFQNVGETTHLHM